MPTYIHNANLIFDKKIIAEKYDGGCSQFRIDWGIAKNKDHQEDDELFSVSMKQLDLRLVMQRGLDFNLEQKHSSDFGAITKSAGSLWDVDWLNHNGVFAWHSDCRQEQKDRAIQIRKVIKEDVIFKTIKTDRADLNKVRPWTTSWIDAFLKDKEHGQKKFKRLETGYPDFDIDKSLIDIVSLEDFIKKEDHRIPLFIGTQFGVYPRIDNVPDFLNGEKICAILGKSVLSGCVSGLSLHQIEKNDTKFKYNKIQYYS